MADPEVAEIRREVEMLRDRLERSHMNEADLSARLERLENRVRLNECDVDPAEFGERMREVSRTLGAAAQLKPLVPEIKAFVSAQIDGAPREEIAKLADALERLCHAEYGVSADVAAESLAASQDTERSLRNRIATATTHSGLDDYGDRIYDEWPDGNRGQFGSSDSILSALEKMGLSAEHPADAPTARSVGSLDLAEAGDFGELEDAEQTVEEEVPAETGAEKTPKPRRRSRGRRGRGKGKSA